MTLCSPWATTNDVCGPCRDDYDTLDLDVLEDKLLIASDLLYMATGQQFRGECEVTVAPCSCASLPVHALVAHNGILTVGAPYHFYTACSCRERATCSCENLSTVYLPFIPAREVSEVSTTDDGTLPLGTYELRGQALVRLDGESWPLCDDDFFVTYTYGRDVPRPLVNAAAVLGCELYMGCHPDAFEGECRLPRNVVAITRQGVSVAMESAFFTAVPGRPIQFGIEEIDMAVALYNPYGLTAPSVFLSPDEPELGRVVT